jgi:hypothetical protein
MKFLNLAVFILLGLTLAACGEKPAPEATPAAETTAPAAVEEVPAAEPAAAAPAEMSAADRLEVIDEAFLVAGRGEIPEGHYTFREGSIGYKSNASRPLRGEVRVSGGGFYHGDRRSVNLTGSWRPNQYFALDLGIERNQIDLPEESFTADVVGARVDLAASTRSFLSAFFQYNTSSEDRVLNLRYNLIHSPLSDLFVVYSERRNGEDNQLLERNFAIKATKLLSF